MERSKIKGEQSGTQAQDQTTKDTKILKICTAKDATSRAGKTYKLAISEFEIGLRKGARPFWRRWQAVDVRPTLQVYKKRRTPYEVRHPASSGKNYSPFWLELGSAACITRNELPPLDQTNTMASLPAGTFPSSRFTSSAFCTGLRLTCRITSPRLMPALSAGLPGCTLVTTTPFTSEGSCSWSRRSGLRFSSPTPQRALPWFSPELDAVSSDLLLMLSSVTGRLRLLPSRITCRVTLFPGRCPLIAACNWPALSIFLPLSSVMTSPTFKPAFAPGESGSTWLTSAPLALSRWKKLAFSGVTSLMPTPIRACSILPSLSS